MSDDEIKRLTDALQVKAKRDFTKAANDLSKTAVAMSVIAELGFSFISIRNSEEIGPGGIPGHRALVIVLSGQIDESILLDVGRYAAGASQDANVGRPTEIMHANSVSKLGMTDTDTDTDTDTQNPNQP